MAPDIYDNNQKIKLIMMQLVTISSIIIITLVVEYITSSPKINTAMSPTAGGLMLSCTIIHYRVQKHVVYQYKIDFG